MSVLQAVDASTATFGRPLTLLTGADSTSGSAVEAGQDISGLAISSSGNVYVLTTKYANRTDLRAKLYSATVAAILGGGGAPIANWAPAKSTFAGKSFIAALGCGRPVGAANDIFLYAHGTRAITCEDKLTADEMVAWQDGRPIGSGKVIPIQQRMGNDFTLNFIAILAELGLRPTDVKSVLAGSIGAPEPTPESALVPGSVPASGGGEPDEE
jgi:hypothetical protein